MSGDASMSLFSRLGRAWVWVVLQFVLTLLLIVAGVAWTRLPDRHIWQVGLTLLVPVLLAICALELEAGTMRKLADDDGGRVKLITGAIALLLWVAIAAAVWSLLDWCDGRIPLWAGYANSRFGAHARASLFTFQHVQRGMVLLEWVVRWVAVPAVLIPCGGATSQWGLRLPLGRILRLLFSIRWWLGVALAGLVGEGLPSHFFDKAPGGTVHAQVWTVGLKLGGAYLLAVSCGIMLLAWWATLFGKAVVLIDEDKGTPVPAIARNMQPVKEGEVLEDEIHRTDAPKAPVLEGEILPPERDPLA